MSRNLLQTRCERCGSRVRMTEPPREITPADAGRYFHDYKGMIVANAECSVCHARYLAWVKTSSAMGWYQSAPEGGFFDLSFRSTFNDEPGEEDLPATVVVYEAGKL